MNNFDEYIGIDEADSYRQSNQSSHHSGGLQDRHRQKKRKISLMHSRIFLIAITVVIYVTATVMLFAFSNGLGTRIEEQNDKTVAANVLQNPVYPKDYENITKDKSEIHNGFLLLVNNNYPCLHDGIDLVNMSENYNHTFQITDYAVESNKTTLEHMNLMFADFKQAVGENDLMISCNYRSKELQEELYNAEVDEKGEDEGSKWVTKPGYSEHQTGYAFDLTLVDDDGSVTEFDGEGKYSWVKDNCEKYGFILRYPDNKTEITGIYHEPWHIRYIGVAHACYIKEHDLCLEEYIDLLKNYSVKKPLEYQDYEMNRWSIYYVPAESKQTSIPVPKGKDYEISGNNVDGFIVSVKMN